MLIRAEPASRLPCAAPAASSPGHSAGRSGRTAPGGRTSALRGSRVAAGAGRASGGSPAGGTPRGRVTTERDGPPSARVAVRRRGAALGGTGQGHPAPRTARTAGCLPLQPLHHRMASAAAPGAAQVSAGPGRGGNTRGAPAWRAATPTCQDPRGGVETWVPQPSMGRFPRHDPLRGQAPRHPGGCGVGEEQVSRGGLARRLGSWQCPWKPFQRSNIFQLRCEQTPGAADQVEGEEEGLSAPGTRGAPQSNAFCLSSALRGCRQNPAYRR